MPAGPQIVVEMDADEAKMWQKFKRIEQAEGGVEAALKAIGRAGKQAANDQAGLERASLRVLKSIESPQERHNQKIAELNRLYGANKLTVDQFRRALTQVREEYAKSTTVVEKNTDALEEAGDAGSRAFGSAMLSQVKGLLGALGLGGGLAGVLGLVNREYDAIVEKQAESARQSMTAADAQIKFLRNLQPETAAERERAIADVEALAMETGVSVKDLYLRAGSAMSARGALSKEAAFKAVKASVRLVPEDMGEGEEVAGAALDLMKVTGGESAEGAAGFLMEVVKRARLTKTGAVARNLVQPLIASMIRGDTEAEAASLFAAITTGAGDVRGEQSGTMMATLSQQLAEELPELPSTRARIEAVQKSPQLQAKILPELKGEAKTKGVVEQLLTGKGGVSAAYQEYLATMPGVEESAETYRSLVGLIQETEIQRTAAFGRTLDASMEQLATADQRGARIGMLREKFGPILRQTGMGAVDTQIAGLMARGSGDQLGDFVRQLQMQETRLRYGREMYQTQGPIGMGTPREPIRLAPTELELQQADVLSQLIEAAGSLQSPAGPQKPAAEPGPSDLYREERRRPAEPAAAVPDRSPPEPVTKPGSSDIYHEQRRNRVEATPAAVPDRWQNATVGGPKPGDLIAPVVPMPVNDLYQQERERTRPPEATAPGRQYRTPEQREMLGAKYATADPSTLPGGNPLLEKQTAVIEQSNKLLQEISNKISPNKPDRRPMPASSSAANTMNRE